MYLDSIFEAAFQPYLRVFVKSDFIITNMIFCVKITSLISAVQKMLGNYLK